MRRPGPLLTLLAGVITAGIAGTLSVYAASSSGRGANTLAVASPSPLPAATPSSAPPAAPPTTSATLGTVVPPRATLAGETADGTAAVAVAVRDRVAVAYVCDGRRVESWMKGTYDGGKLALMGKGGDALQATSTAQDTTAGQITVRGKALAFVIKIVHPPSGLYRSAAKVRKRLEGAWIVLPDGRQFGLLNGAAAPSLDLSALTAKAPGGAVFPAAPIDGVSGSGF